jgi:hypothetical protein
MSPHTVFRFFIEQLWGDERMREDYRRIISKIVRAFEA